MRYSDDISVRLSHDFCWLSSHGWRGAGLGQSEDTWPGASGIVVFSKRANPMGVPGRPVRCTLYRDGASAESCWARPGSRSSRGREYQVRARSRRVVRAMMNDRSSGSRGPLSSSGEASISARKRR